MPGQPFEPRPTQLIQPDEDGTTDADKLNADLTQEYLDDKCSPRWVAKATVAYLWARTVTCKNCRATMPLLKTRWLCKKANRRVRLLMKPKDDGTSVQFSIEHNVPARGGNTAQKREHDKKLGEGTMSRAGAQCPCTYLRPTLLAIDEVGYLGYDAHAADLLFQVVSRRYEQKSIVITTNLPFKQWNTVFPNAACAVALIDRLTHHAEIISIEGESYRKREAEQAQKAKQTQKPQPSPKPKT